ncbi:MAG: hypothetical protein A2Y07_07355 [Planctomycetes bacterium GWF2_50_10]|nr:MAG: hypothetical protein A2Y07_07355 [Planctomycetes bacterium GWF2_50_10]
MRFSSSPTVLALVIIFSLTTFTIPAHSSIPTEYIGHWKGNATIIVNWTKQKNLPIEIKINSDGTVTGTVGDATLVNGTLIKKSWIYTKIFQHENPYRIESDLQGKIIKSENIQRDSVYISLRIENGKVDGGLATSGTKTGNKETMILSAMNVSLSRIDENSADPQQPATNNTAAKYPPTFIAQPTSPCGTLAPSSDVNLPYDVNDSSKTFELLDISFQPLQHGKNIVSVTLKNHTSSPQHFGIGIYTRSPDYTSCGMGWGTSFGCDFSPGQAKTLRYAFKIQGPITSQTYIRLSLYDSNELPNNAKPYCKKTYMASSLQQLDKYAHSKRVGKEQQKLIYAAFEKIKYAISNEDYQAAWSQFTDDFKQAEFQRSGYDSFVERMTKPSLSLWFFSRLDILGLTLDSVTETGGSFILWAKHADQNETWRFIFVPASDGLKLDWIYYTPRLVYSDAN